jgi:hypothetical protein
MKSWLQIAPDYWRKDVELPLGHVLAEIHKRDAIPWYSTRVQVTFVDDATPRGMVKSDIGAASLAAAEEQCEVLIAALATIDRTKGQVTTRLPDSAAPA